MLDMEALVGTTMERKVEGSKVGRRKVVEMTRRKGQEADSATW
jgi:hypothetical protein